MILHHSREGPESLSFRPRSTENLRYESRHQNPFLARNPCSRLSTFYFALRRKPVFIILNSPPSRNVRNSASFTRCVSRYYSRTESSNIKLSHKNFRYRSTILIVCFMDRIARFRADTRGILGNVRPAFRLGWDFDFTAMWLTVHRLVITLYRRPATGSKLYSFLDESEVPLNARSGSISRDVIKRRAHHRKCRLNDTIIGSMTMDYVNMVYHDSRTNGVIQFERDATTETFWKLFWNSLNNFYRRHLNKVCRIHLPTTITIWLSLDDSLEVLLGLYTMIDPHRWERFEETN